MTHFAIPTSASASAGSFSETVAIDISDFKGAGDYISFSLPEFPRTKLDITKTFVDFTSHPTGDFGIGPTDRIAFSSASPALPETAGDTEMRIPITLLTKVNKATITGVRFRLIAKEKCTFRCLSIRACSQNWKYAPIDFDTLWHRVHRPPSPDGKASPTIAFPEATNEPKKWPIVFRSNPLSGLSDPMPVNVRLGVSFTAGSFAKALGTTEENFNQLALYLRDIPTDDQTMVELNGNGLGTGGFNQAQLDGIGHQPDFGRAAYRARKQAELDIESQSEIDTVTQWTLERLPDETEHSWIEVKLKWCATQSNNQLTIFDADGVGYTFTEIPIAASSESNLEVGNFILLIDLQDHRIRVQIYALDQVGNIQENQLVFDSGQIVDDNLLKRRRGRVGWWSQLVDGDAHLHSIRTRGVNYGEIVSKEFQSITPVKGATIFAGATGDIELNNGLEATDKINSTVTVDPSASASGKAYKVVTTPLKSLQGIATSAFEIDDPSNLSISFDINFPSSEIPGEGLSAFLLGSNSQIIPLNLPNFARSTWAHIKLGIPPTLFQTGKYQLVLMQSLPVVATTWWVDNLSVKTASVKWWARSHPPDAWGEPDERWQAAGFTLNSLNGGIVFDEIGNGLQVKAQALRQDAAIHDFKVVPQYATLGRVVWPETVSSGSSPSSLSITTSIEKRTVAFTAAATDTDGYVASYTWSFGDDEYDSGKNVSHIYLAAGTYVVTLTAIDNFGNASTTQKSVTVS